jgi:polyhydroxyalkanoate synthase subunit PhaE
MMNPLDYSKAVTDFWSAQGRALLQAQEQVGKVLAEGMQAAASGMMPTIPSMPDTLSAEAEDLARAAQSVVKLWSAATTACGKLATTVPSIAGGDGITEATFRKMVDPRSWTGAAGGLDEVLGRMAEGPRFADLWEIERRFAGVLQAWMNLRRRSLEHNAVVLGAWLQAARQFSEQLAARKVQTLDAKAALTLWTDTANQHLLETQRSEPFLQTQAALIRATTELRMAQHELVEHFGKQYGFPTRTELDDVHRTLTELRRELRAMQREQRKPAPHTASPDAPKPRPPQRLRRTGAKRRKTAT